MYAFKATDDPEIVKFCIICFFFAIIVTSPKPVLQFHKLVNFENNITGHICPSSSFKPSIFAVIYSYFALLFFILYVFILLIIYFVIGIKMYIRYKERQRKRVNTIEENVFSRMIYITLTVTIVFTLSYLTVFLLQITLQEDRLSSVQIALMRIIEQSYILHHGAKPFIYSMFDERFRKNFCQLVSLKFLKPEKKNNVSVSGIMATSVVFNRLDDVALFPLVCIILTGTIHNILNEKKNPTYFQVHLFISKVIKNDEAYIISLMQQISLFV